MKERKREVDPDFDGHPERDLTRMSPKEKLLYLSEQIEMRHFIKKHVRKVSPSPTLLRAVRTTEATENTEKKRKQKSTKQRLDCF